MCDLAAKEDYDVCVQALEERKVEDGFCSGVFDISWQELGILLGSVPADARIKWCTNYENHYTVIKQVKVVKNGETYYEVYAPDSYQPPKKEKKNN